MRALLSLASVLCALIVFAFLGVGVFDLPDQPGDAPSRADAAIDVVPPASVTVPGRFFRWRDAAGHIHYDSSPPPSPIAAQEIPFLRKLPVAEPATITEPGAGRAGRLAERVSPLSVYSAEGIAELIEDVERTAELLDARDQQVEAMQGLLKGGER